MNRMILEEVQIRHILLLIFRIVILLAQKNSEPT